MLRPGGIPQNIDAATANQIARSLLVVRVVRGGALLVFLVVSLGAVLAKDWPRGVAVAVALTVALQAARLAFTVRGYLRATRRQS